MENFIFSISTVSHTPDVGAQQNRDKQRVAWLIETRRVTTERKRVGVWAECSALVFGERRRLSPLVPTAIGRVLVRVRVRSQAL